MPCPRTTTPPRKWRPSRLVSTNWKGASLSATSTQVRPTHPPTPLFPYPPTYLQSDMDSIGSAVGGAYLYGGVAARSEETVNGEIEFALRYARYKEWVEGGGGEGKIAYASSAPPGEGGGGEGGELLLPPLFASIDGAVDPFNKGVGICMVDCNAPEQMVKEVGAVAFPSSSSSPPDVEKTKAALAMRSRIKGELGGWVGG